MSNRTRRWWRPAGMTLAVVLAVVAMWAALQGLASPGSTAISASEAGQVSQVDGAPLRAQVGDDDFGVDFGDEFWDVFWDEFWGALDDEEFWDEESWDDEFAEEDYWDDEFAEDDFWDDEFGDDFWDDEFDDDFFSDDFGFQDEEGDVLAEFQVVDGQLVVTGSDVSSDNLAAYQAIWDRFVQLIPADEREMVALFELYSDGRDGILAAVAPLEGDPTLWLLSVDPADVGDAEELDATLIHEFAHLLTLNDSQVPGIDEADFFALDRAEQSCSTYFPGEGCANADSYIHLFVERFWTNLLDEFGDLEELDDDAYWDAVDEITERYGDHFVTEYAMTNPAEDIAETFAIFVLEDRPTGNTVAEQKLLFLYDFPELVTLRDEIRAGL